METRTGKIPFEEVYDRYYGRIYKAIYMRILDTETTEDLIQDTFLKAMKAYDRYDPDQSSVYTWLYTIAMNTLYDHFRRHETRKVIALEDYMESGAEPAVDDPELERLTDGYAGEAYRILKQLNQKERDLISMRFGLELSYKEIAQRISSSEKAVAKRMERLLAKCRRIAEQQDPE